MRVREFAGKDFDVVSRLLGEQWHAEHGPQAYWQGADELCDFLAHTDAGYVVEGDAGEVMGVVLLSGVRPQDRNETMRMHWLQQRTRLAAMAAALGINSRADAAVLNDERQLMDVAEERLGQAGQIVLLFVAPQARGRGVGRTLLQEADAWFATHEVGTVRLVTDDACDWQVYEHLGMERVQEDSSKGIYVYQSQR
ncbi:MAG: GNAT family N-acetyltransferase [Coriobacteriales bacterium]|nr:GNAT family N-acetyltransferase [Coriobacteriales bacterium]